MHIVEPKPIVATAATPSNAARIQMLSRRGEPLFLADWMRVLMIHLEVDAGQLRRAVPYQLDLYESRAFVTLVAFSMEDMHPRVGGRFGAWLFKPIATHDFLNVRTYVKHNGESGIHFLTEWLSNRLAVALGPRTFSLPYRHGFINYAHEWEAGRVCGRVTDSATRMEFSYRADLEIGAPFTPCERGSLDEWLMERYAAFNCVCERKRFFRIWHPPWPQCRADVSLEDSSLIEQDRPWFGDAHLAGANFSPGIRNVWMGRPFDL